MPEKKKKGSWPYPDWDGIHYPEITGGKGPKKFTASGFKGITFEGIKMDFSDKHKGHETKRGLSQDQKRKSQEPHEKTYRKKKKESKKK